MSAHELLEEMTKNGVVFKASGDRLKVVAKNGYMTPEKLSIVRKHKAELITLIVSNTSGKTIFRYPPPIKQLQEYGLDVLHEDWLFLSAQLPVDDDECDEAVKSYIAVWLQAMKQEPLNHKKQNVGRRAANTFLREKFKRPY